MISNIHSEIMGVQAGGQISADGSVVKTLGCSLTRTGVGTYELVLPDGRGLPADQCYVSVTPRVLNFAIPPLLSLPSVVDETNNLKIIRMISIVGDLFDFGFTVLVFRSAL